MTIILFSNSFIDRNGEEFSIALLSLEWHNQAWFALYLFPFTRQGYGHYRRSLLGFSISWDICKAIWYQVGYRCFPPIDLIKREPTDELPF